MSKKKLTEEEELYKKELYKQEQKEYRELSQKYSGIFKGLNIPICGTPMLEERQQIREKYKMLKKEAGII